MRMQFDTNQNVEADVRVFNKIRSEQTQKAQTVASINFLLLEIFINVKLYKKSVYSQQIALERHSTEKGAIKDKSGTGVCSIDKY